MRSLDLGRIGQLALVVAILALGKPVLVPVALAFYLAFVLTGILFLVIEPYSRNPTIRFHAFQSIFFWIAVIVGGMALSMISFVILALPFVGWIISFLLSLAYWLGALVLWLYLMYKDYNRERVVMPVIGPWAEKQAQSF